MKIGLMATSFGVAEIHTGRYAAKGALSVQLITCSEDGVPEPLGMLSTNLPERGGMLRDDEFFAKTWLENESFVATALASGHFTDTGRRVRAGYVEAPIWRINAATQ